MIKSNISTLAIAGAIRYLLIISKYANIIRSRIEVSTPLNSWKRVHEGAYLYENGINPYDGDLYHQNPLVLIASNMLITIFDRYLPCLFVVMDWLTGIMLYLMARRFVEQMYSTERKNAKNFAPATEHLQLQLCDISNIPTFVAVAYLFNPYSILNCVGQTTTVWSNFLLASFYLSLAYKNTLMTCICLALETQINFYPIVLIVPAVLILSSEKKEKTLNIVSIVVVFLTIFAMFNLLGYFIVGSWNFLDATYGFILNHYDLHPNIGLFWYFFAEMFEHFRSLFLFTFQMNATILYVLPLTIKMHKQPLLLITILAALITIFRSYPCIGDVAFYMSLIPLWKRSTSFMANNFVVFCFFLITSTLAPTVWYLWIYCNSANANFYFGATLAFASAQIFLVTDIMFATNKREFCLQHGLNPLNKIILE